LSSPVTATAPQNAGSEAPSPAVAPPPGHPRFPLFDALRGIAVVSVLTFHVAGLTGALDSATFGDPLAILSRSLILFFVISGFLLYRPFVAARATGRPRPSVARYLRRRALRILPAYWVALTALAIFPAIVGVFSGDWWIYYGFLQAYSQETFSGGIPVAWSLCVEVTYYLLLPLWVIAIGGLRLGAGPNAWLRAELVPLGLIAAGGIVVQVLAAQQEISYLVATSLLGQITWLALGMALAVVSVAAERAERPSLSVRFVTERPGACWIGAALAYAGLTLLLQPGGGLAIAAALATAQPVAETLAAIALTGALVVLLVLPAVFGDWAGGLPRRVLAARPIAWLGVISYGIFLYHLPIAELLALADDPQHFSASGLDLAAKIGTATTPILIALTLAATAAVAAVSYYVVELPFLRRKET
jgi:peptidoglycan/LPS O-acetylase OafA/YrhL